MKCPKCGFEFIRNDFKEEVIGEVEKALPSRKRSLAVCAKCKNDFWRTKINVKIMGRPWLCKRCAEAEKLNERFINKSAKEILAEGRKKMLEQELKEKDGQQADLVERP